MYRFLMSKRYVNLMFSLGRINIISKLSKEPKINMTISHLSNVTDQWKKEGLITKVRKGRETEIKLTTIGETIVGILREYDDIAINQLNKINNKKEEEEDEKVEGKSEVVQSN